MRLLERESVCVCMCVCVLGVTFQSGGLLLSPEELSGLSGLSRRVIILGLLELLLYV